MEVMVAGEGFAPACQIGLGEFVRGDQELLVTVEQLAYRRKLRIAEQVQIAMGGFGSSSIWREVEDE